MSQYPTISNKFQQYEILGFVQKWCAGAYAVRYSAVRMPMSNGSVFTVSIPHVVAIVPVSGVKQESGSSLVAHPT